MVMIWGAAGLTLLVVSAAAIWGLHKLCLQLEERGYLYYRKRPEGGGGGAGIFMEMDRLSRPSIEHVMEVRDTATRKEQQNADGD